jgi:hypothetical protein
LCVVPGLRRWIAQRRDVLWGNPRELRFVNTRTVNRWCEGHQHPYDGYRMEYVAHEAHLSISAGVSAKEYTAGVSD